MAQRQSSYNYEEILACSRGELFGPGNAQLPLPPMLMVHRITDISETGGAFGKGYIRAEYDVRPDDWYFPCHFKGDQVMAFNPHEWRLQVAPFAAGASAQTAVIEHTHQTLQLADMVRRLRRQVEGL